MDKRFIAVLNKEITEEKDYGSYLRKTLYKIEGENLVKYVRKICLDKNCFKSDTTRSVVGYSKNLFLKKME